MEAIEKIGDMKGKLGDLLAEGTMRASRKIGKDSWKWAIHNSKGLEQSGVETRSAKGYALAFAVDPRGPDHLFTEVLAEFGGTPTRIALVKKLTGDEKWANSHLKNSMLPRIGDRRSIGDMRLRSSYADTEVQEL
jgi:aldehyde:ferredoxin oxidoreductase